MKHFAKKNKKTGQILRLCGTFKSQKVFSFRGRLLTPTRGSAPGALPLDPTGGFAPGPRYRLALHALTMGSAPPRNGNLWIRPGLKWVIITASAVFRAPQHPQLRGAADLARGRKGVGKFFIAVSCRVRLSSFSSSCMLHGLNRV